MTRRGDVLTVLALLATLVLVTDHPWMWWSTVAMLTTIAVLLVAQWVLRWVLRRKGLL